MEQSLIFRIEGQGHEDLLNQLGLLEKANKELRDEMTEINKKYKETGKLTEEDSKRLAENRIQIKENNKEIRVQQKLYTTSIKNNKQIDDSIRGIGERLSIARDRYDRLSKSQRETTKEGIDLLKNIQKLDKDYKDLTATTGRFTASVGDYSNSIENVIDGKMNMRTAMKEMREELARMTLAGESGTEEFVKMRNALSSIQDAVDKTGVEVKRFADDFKVIKDVVDTTNFMVQGFSLVTSVTALMGVESEKLEKTLKNLVAIGNVANSVNNMSNIIMKNQHVLKKISIFLTASWTTATGLLTKATIALGLAMKALGIGLIIGAVVGLIAVFRNLGSIISSIGGGIRRFGRWLGIGKDKTDELTDSTEKLDNSQQQLIRTLERKEKALKNQIDSMEFELRLMKIMGVETDILIEKERQLLQMKFEAAEAAYEAAIARGRQTGQEIENMDELIDKMRDARRELLIFNTQVETDEKNRIKKQREEREKARQQELEAEIKHLKDINDRNELAQAELNYIINDSLENRIKIEDIKHKQRIESSELTAKELELIELQHQKNIQKIIDDYRDELLTKDDENRQDDLDKEEERRIQDRERYLQELEQRRLDEMEFFEQRKELLDDWLERGVITEEEYTKEIILNNQKRLNSEKQLARERVQVNLQMTSFLLSSMSQIAEGSSKLFGFMKRASQLEALINTYVALTQVLRDPTLTTYAKIAASAGVLATGLGAVATIQRQSNPNVPQFKEGGIIGGRPHSQGGTKFYGQDGSVFEAEKGEYLAIVNRKDASRAAMLDQINQTHGKPMLRNSGRFFREGGTFEPRQDFNQNMTEELREVIDEITHIPVIVSVRDINNGQEEYRVVTTRGDLKK